MSILHNVQDNRTHVIGPWEVAPLEYYCLLEADKGRTVIYLDHGRAEAGTLSSWRDGKVWARFSEGDTAACCDPKDLVFGIRRL